MRKRDILIALGAIVAAFVLVISQFWGEALEAGAWGLHFSTEGQPPKGPADRQTLQKYDADYLGNTDERVLYLTFDAGYENGYTAQILDVLQKHKAPAAFFLVGSYIEKNADLVRRMVEDGHIVGNHTMNHPDMSAISDPASFAKELQAVETLFTRITGKELPKYYRPPQGVYSQQNLEAAQKQGYKTLFWSLAYADWRNDAQPTHQAAFQKILPRVHNGAVILLHATSRTNAEILDELLTQLEEKGYRFASINEIF